MSLVKYDCNCIGLTPGKDHRALILRACDYSGDIHIERRNMEGKAWEPVSDELVNRINDDLETVYAAARRLDHLKESVSTVKKVLGL